FPVPAALQPNIAFWLRIFTELDTNSGVLHDAVDVTVIYHTFASLPSDRHQRLQLIDQHREHYQTILETLAGHQGQPQNAEAQRVLALFPTPLTPDQYRAAAQRMRFQRGLRDQFAAGLARSGAYLPILEPIFQTAGLPAALTWLPHIESSFNNRAYSRSGAAGIWQLTQGAGRRFLTINEVVDERFDIRRASRAAAQVLHDNYRKLGTWPLAITAYNHGAYGMRQAVDQVGSTDFGVIVQQYQSPTFGFASRNFYAEFLAVLDIMKNPEQRFPGLLYDSPRKFHRLKLKAYVTLSSLETYLGVDRRDLRRWNPFLRRVLSSTYLRIPKGVTLYVAQEQMRQGALQARWNAIPSRLKFTDQLDPVTIRVRSGETLSHLARRLGTTTSALAQANGLRQPYRIRVGQRIRVPYQLATNPRYRVRTGETLSTIAERVVMSQAVLAKMNNLKPPYRLRAGQMLRVPAYDPQYRRYWVRPGETLSAIAKRAQLTVAAIAEMNSLKRPYIIRKGQFLRLPRSGPPPRRYRVRQGDALSVIAERAGTTVTVLAALNNLQRPYRIRPGQLLKLPAQSAQTAQQQG
ncbi:MAG: LysM peptidoglycan-binding domain-containing protein, partial [Candidatus Tectomicrobia bacterium]|nr:LysM peptidoglycan-binding domain-containing protein [Candidatus Tectomicrobia bacterium]